MNIAEFLSVRGTGLSAIMAKVDATVGLGAGDVLLAVGSLAEGLGNRKSDLDLLLISPRGKGSHPPPEQAALVVGRCLIDVRILRVAEIEELLARFERWSQLPWNVTHAVKFTLEERTLLHRLLHGQMLHKGKKERITAQMPSLADVARLKLHVARQTSRTVQVDMVGYRDAGDFRSLIFASQELLGHAVDALLAGYLLTNPIIKWRMRMLESVPSDWEQLLGVRPTGLTAADQMWRLHRAPARVYKRIALEHAFRITTLARAVFVWAETHLVNAPVMKQKPATWPRIERKPRDSRLPYLDFDVDFFLGEDRVTIARLNEFDEVIEMSPREFRLTLLFDGTTTVREAEQIINGSRRGRRRSSVIDQLLFRVTRAGLSFSPNGNQSRDDYGQESSSLRTRRKRS